MDSTGAPEGQTMRSIRPHSKMRTGCVECKRRRIKCDEGKPICVRCKHRPEKCKYEFKLSWTGGRPFKNRPQGDSQSSSQSPPDAQNAPASGSFTTGEADPNRKFSTVSTASTASTTSTISTGSGNSTSSGEWIFETMMAPTASSQERQYSFQSDHSAYQKRGSSDVIAATNPMDPPETAMARRIPPTNANQTTTLSKSLARKYPYKKRAQREDELTERKNKKEMSPFFQQIQYALSTNPSQLTSSPESRFFLHHYINVTADVIFPLSLTGNPLREDLLRSAMSNPHLLNAFLACACSHYARRHEGMPVQLANSITRFTNASLNGLRRAMTDPKQAGKLETVSTALALCTSDVISGDLSTWRIHLTGANKLIMSAFRDDKKTASSPASSITSEYSSSSSEPDGRNPLETFVIKWYALLDIFAGVSGLRESSNSSPDGRYWSSNEDDTYIDEWTGYSLDLMPIITKIGNMARVHRQKTQVMVVDDDSEEEIVDTQLHEESLEEIRQMENLIYSLYNRTAHPELVNSPNPDTRKRAEEMQCIHRAFLYTALLHLYRRVQDLPKYHTKAVYAVHMIIETIQMIPRESSSNILTLWPVFTVGCETDDPEQRKIIEQRISRMEAFGMGNVQTARQAMHAYWESGATERWDIFLESYGQDIVLF